MKTIFILLFTILFQSSNSIHVNKKSIHGHIQEDCRQFDFTNNEVIETNFTLGSLVEKHPITKIEIKENQIIYYTQKCRITRHLNAARVDVFIYKTIDIVHYLKTPF